MQVKKGRVEFLDAARGVAMFFVLLSHFSGSYFRGQADQFWPSLLYRIGMIASPTFTIVSGLLLGFLLSTTGSKFNDIRTKLIDRALFLLTIGHLLIAGSFWTESALLSFMRTDCIALSVILGALIVGRLGAQTRLVLGVSTYVFGWLVVGFWTPVSGMESAVEHVAFGSLDIDNFPLVPWFSLYIGSSAIGEWFGSMKLDTIRRDATRLAIISAICVGLVGVFALIKHASRWTPFHHVLLNQLLWAGQKYPPGPMYLLLYGGLGFAIVSALMIAQSAGSSRALKTMAAVGQSAFFIYVIHFYLFDALSLLQRRPVFAWPLFFVLSCLAIGLAATQWQSRNGNRLLTVGLPTMARSVQQRIDALS
jgi:uncharacterized membrane protein